MERFVHRHNIERYRRLLQEVTDEDTRKTLERLLAQEEAKERPDRGETGAQTSG